MEHDIYMVEHISLIAYQQQQKNSNYILTKSDKIKCPKKKQRHYTPLVTLRRT